MLYVTGLCKLSSPEVKLLEGGKPLSIVQPLLICILQIYIFIFTELSRSEKDFDIIAQYAMMAMHTYGIHYLNINWQTKINFNIEGYRQPSPLILYLHSTISENGECQLSGFSFGMKRYCPSPKLSHFEIAQFMHTIVGANLNRDSQKIIFTSQSNFSYSF